MLIKLNEYVLRHDLRCPAEKSRVELCDSEIPGLYVEVRATRQGQGTYYLRYKNRNGKTCHRKIGRTPEIDLAEARKRAKKVKAEIALGADPRGDAVAAREVPTLDAFFANQYTPFAQPRLRSFPRTEELYRLRIRDKFGSRRLNEITRQQVQTFHTELRKSGLAEATCDLHIKLLKRCFSLAGRWNVFPGPNPIVGVQMFNPDNRRERYLTEEEMARLLEVLRADPNRNVCRIVQYLASVGCRLNEALSARWSDIDRVNGVWRIPAANSKSRKLHTVPLNASALVVLESVGTAGSYEHVFVNEETGRPYTTIAKVWHRLRTTAGLHGLRLHDLRHDFASRMVRAGRTLYEVQQVLGHSDPKISQRYAHLDLRTLQSAANTASLSIGAETADEEAA